MVFTARSNATQAIILLWVKCRLPPRTSQMPSSGSRQMLSRYSTTAASRFQASGAGPSLSPARQQRYMVSISSPNTSCCRCCEARLPMRTGRRALVARQPVEDQLGQAALAGDPVHQLQLRRRAGRRPQQPLPERPRLVQVARLQQRVQGEGGVAQPAEAVVPVAHAPDALGQRRGRRRHQAAGGRVGQRLQHDQRAHDRVPPAAAVAGLGRPLLPPLLGVGQHAAAVQRGRRGDSCDGYQVELERSAAGPRRRRSGPPSTAPGRRSRPASPAAGCPGRPPPPARRASCAPRGRSTRSRSGCAGPCASAPGPRRPSTTLSSAVPSSCSGRKSMTATVPSGVSNSRLQHQRVAPVAAAGGARGRLAVRRPAGRSASGRVRACPAGRRSRRANRSAGRTTSRWSRPARPGPRSRSPRSGHSPRGVRPP